MPLLPGRHHHGSPQVKSSSSMASVIDKVSPSLRPTLSNSSRSHSSKSPKTGSSTPNASSSSSNNNTLTATTSRGKGTPKSSPSIFGSDPGHSSPSLTALAAPVPPASLDIRIESPPLVLYGNPKESTGTLLSGIFDVIINQDTPFPMKSVDLVVGQVLKQKKPNPNKCPHCKEHTTELARWNVLSHAADLPKGKHGYPFSHLIPGSLPATCDNNAFNISYYIEATAVPLNASSGSSGKSTHIAKPIVLHLPLTISRSIIKGPDKNSVRVFPPTDLTATLSLPSVVYPVSNYNFEMMLEGVHSVSKGKTSKWKLRKINWKLDETIKMSWGVCPLHAAPYEERLAAANAAVTNADGTATPVDGGHRSNGNPSNGHAIHNDPGSPAATSADTTSTDVVEASLSETLHTTHLEPPLQPQTSGPSSSHNTDHRHHNHSPLSLPLSSHKDKEKDKDKTKSIGSWEEVRTIRSGDFKNGWKSDFTGKGKIEFSTQDIQIPHNICTRVDDPILGLSVTHVLIVELIIAEETVVAKSSRQAMPTGAARVLRMQFNLVVTSRSGLGIAWDDEVPPVYGDVPLSPPEYDHVAELPKFEELTPSVAAVQGINSTESLRDYEDSEIEI